MILETGYVGLVTRTCFSESGDRVRCAGTDDGRIVPLRKGEITFHDPPLTEPIMGNIASGGLTFPTGYEEGVKVASFILPSTPTTSVPGSVTERNWEESSWERSHD